MSEAWLSRWKRSLPPPFERFRRFSQSAFQPRCFSYRRAIGRCSRCFIACVGRSSFDRVGSLLATLFYHSHPPRLLTRFTPQILQRQKHGTLVSAAKAAKRIEEVHRVCDERIDRRNDASPFRFAPRFAPRSASPSTSNSTTYRGIELPRIFGETIDDTWDESGSRSTR